MKDTSAAPGKSLKNLASFKQSAASVSGQTIVKETDGGLPPVLQPTIKGVNLIAWTRDNQPLIQARLLKYGGLLFRGFKLKDVSEFEGFMTAISGELLEYIYGSTPRRQVSGRVYTSTEYPAHQSIPLHNEMSYARSWPQRIWFFCQTPAASGGETPLAESRKVFALIKPAIKEKFMRKQVMYVRNYGEGIDLTWQQAFRTTSRAEVEDYCRQAEIEYQWREGDRLRTRHVCQSVIRHPQTGEMVWFNQAHLFHPSSLEPDFRAKLSAQFSEEDLPRNVFYGDGTPIETAALDQIREAYREASITFSWQEGDILMLDNILTAHGRSSYSGPRSILVGMA